MKSVLPVCEHIWQKLYTTIRNVNSKHKDAHHKALEINPNFVLSYSLSGFILCLKIWILESSSVTDHWWSKLSEEILRGRFWSKHFPFQNWEYFGQLFPQAKKPNYNLYPNRVEAQSEWFTKINDFFKWYTPRAPLVEYIGLFGDYLKKLSSARTLREKDREAWSSTQSSSKEVSLQTRVKDLEGLCNSLMILPKEIKSLKARVYKLETIINVINPKTKAINVKHKVNTAGTKDKVESVGKQCDLDAFDDFVDAVIDFYYFQWFDCNLYSNLSYNITLNAKLEEVDKDLSQDDCVKDEKQEARIMLNRLAEQRRLRLQLMLEEENSMKSIDRSNFTHMKLALEKCRTTKRRCQDLKPWEEVFIPINEPNQHWSLAQFHIKSRNVTFYDSQETFDVEIHPWYVKIRRCLESKLHVVLKEIAMFVSKGIDPTHYSIKFRHAQNIPKQGGVFGDYGVFVCLFLYRLAHGIPLDVKDPIQTALAYREKMINFFFDHKIIFPS
ncbi:phospholipase-like, aminotransferase-like mobile domain protein [Tanacetum coccineum]